MNTISTVEEPIFAKPNKSTKLAMKPWRRVAWLLILLADVGLLLWGAMAALAPEHLLGPGGVPILSAEYEGFTGHPWPEVVSTSPLTAGFITLLFRMYGTYGVAFSLVAIAITITAFRRGDSWAWWALLIGNTLTYIPAMVYDRAVRAIGPFEMTEYLGLGAVYLALVVTAPFLAAGRKGQSTS